jgi:predicted DNA-binding protein (MmcQ/YjbR family)
MGRQPRAAAKRAGGTGRRKPAATSGDRALTRFRRRCLGLPETSEAGSWGHPNFRAGKKTFAAFEWVQGRPSVAVRLDAAEVDYLRSHQKNFFLTPYGRGLWVSVWADTALDWKLIDSLVESAYRKVALQRMLAVLDASA